MPKYTIYNKKVMKTVKLTENKLREVISEVINENENIKQYVKNKQKENLIQGLKVDIHNLRTTIKELLTNDYGLDSQLLSYIKDIYEVL